MFKIVLLKRLINLECFRVVFKIINTYHKTNASQPKLANFFNNPEIDVTIILSYNQDCQNRELHREIFQFYELAVFLIQIMCVIMRYYNR